MIKKISLTGPLVVLGATRFLRRPRVAILAVTADRSRPGATLAGRAPMRVLPRYGEGERHRERAIEREEQREISISRGNLLLINTREGRASKFGEE